MPVRRKPKNRMSGKGIMSTLLSGLKAAHKLVKEHKVVSRGLTHFGHPKAAQIAKQLGYGKRQRGGAMSAGYVMSRPIAF